MPACWRAPEAVGVSRDLLRGAMSHVPIPPCCQATCSEDILGLHVLGCLCATLLLRSMSPSPAPSLLEFVLLPHCPFQYDPSLRKEAPSGTARADTAFLHSAAWDPVTSALSALSSDAEHGPCVCVLTLAGQMSKACSTARPPRSRPPHWFLGRQTILRNYLLLFPFLVGGLNRALVAPRHFSEVVISPNVRSSASRFPLRPPPRIPNRSGSWRSQWEGAKIHLVRPCSGRRKSASPSSLHLSCRGSSQLRFPFWPLSIVCLFLLFIASRVHHSRSISSACEAACVGVATACLLLPEHRPPRGRSHQTPQRSHTRCLSLRWPGCFDPSPRCWRRAPPPSLRQTLPSAEADHSARPRRRAVRVSAAARCPWRDRD